LLERARRVIPAIPGTLATTGLLAQVALEGLLVTLAQQVTLEIPATMARLVMVAQGA
jgi:hypothetical protein